MKKTLIGLLFLLTSVAHAGVHVEPFIGLAKGSGDTGRTEHDYTTPQFGARVGWSHLGLAIGGEYSMASFDRENTFTLNGVEQKSETPVGKNQYGIFVSYEAPILFRAWGTYFLNSTMDFDNDSTLQIEGSGFGLGLGYTGLPYISINLEYRSFSFDEFEDTDATPSSGSLRTDTDLSEIMLSVSLPLVL